MTPDLVLLGNLLVDDVVFPDGRTRMGQAGGAMLYAALAAALWGTKPGCVSLLGDDYPLAALVALEARGVSLDGVHRLHARGVRTWLLYEGGVRRVVHRLACPSHEAVSPTPEHVPEAWRKARAFHLAPMPFETQRALVQAIRAWESPKLPAFISLDPHLPITTDTRELYQSLLAHVDAFFPSDDEMRLDESDRDPAATLASLCSGRIRFVAWKRGAKGGSLYDARERRLHEWPPRAERVEDPTGAGDAFMAGYVTAHLAGEPVDRCLRRAVVTASLAFEAWGADGLLAATPEIARARLVAWAASDASEIQS